TSVERLALLRAPFRHFAFRAFRALHPDGFLLHVLAARIIAAGGEFAESSALQEQVAAALRTLFIECLVRLLLRPADLFRGLTVGVCRACEKGAEAALLEDHGTSAVLTVFFFALIREIDFVDVGQIDRQLASIGAEIFFSAPG